MNTIEETTHDHLKMGETSAPSRIQSPYAQVGRFFMHLLEMSIPMGLGMVIFGLLVRELRTSPFFATAFQSGAGLYIIGDGLFMTVPMVAWMVFRGHGWQHSVEMGAAMFAPGVAIIVLGWLGAYAYLPWLGKVVCLPMCLSMLAYMLYHRDHFTGKVSHSAHALSQQTKKLHH